QFDFYRLRAFFDPAELFKDQSLPRPPGSVEVESAGPAARLRELTMALLALEESARKRLKTEKPDLQPTTRDIQPTLSDDERARHDAASAEIVELRKTYKPPDVPLGRIAKEDRGQLKPSYFLVRGDFRRPGPEVHPAFLRIANWGDAAVQDRAPQSPTTG